MGVMELTLAEIRAIEFDILKHFKLFCEQQGLRYYLSNGTLLGAVKYGGFIPWDDDIDVFVPREDYDKLLELYQNNDKYKLFSYEREPSYRFTFAKLCDITTIKEENNIDNGVQLGVDIDIFPLDSCTSHMLLSKVQRKIKIYQAGCVLSKFVSSQGRAIYKRCIIGYCKMRKYHYFHKALTKIVEKEKALGESYKGCLMWPIYGKREIVSADVFADTIEVNFEGERFSAPIGYDVYLRSLYGDYEQEPPKDKQKTHHGFRARRIVVNN